MSTRVDLGPFANYFKQGLGYNPLVTTNHGFMFPVCELYLEDALELTSYNVGHNSCYAIRKKEKKTTPTKDVSQLTRLVNRRISSFMGGIDD